MSNILRTRERAGYSNNVRDFESLLLFFSEEEIVKLQSAIDERRSRRLAPDEERSLESADQSDYSPNLAEENFSEV
jgi:hypothetical protein